MYCAEKDFMENNQAMLYYIQSETKLAEDPKVSKRFIMKQKLECDMQQQRNG